MAKQTFSVGQVLTAAQMTSLQETAMGGGAASAKTANYVLVAADAGTTISMTSTSATTITVNTGLFAAGDTVFIQNLGSGTCTITAGTATVNTAGSLILPQYDAGILYFVSASSAIFYDYIQVGATSPLTTKGDLYTFGSSDTRIGVGANDTVLTADSSTATGLKWATPSSGGMTLISETVASSNSSISLSSIPGTYKQLMLVWGGLYLNANASFGLRLNNDSSGNYQYGYVESLDSVNTGSYDTATSFTTTVFPIAVNVTDATLRHAGKGTLLIDNYASTTKLKRCNLNFQWVRGDTGVQAFGQLLAYYNSTSAITSIDIFRNSGTGVLSNVTNTSIRLYGIS